MPNKDLANALRGMSKKKDQSQAVSSNGQPINITVKLDLGSLSEALRKQKPDEEDLGEEHHVPVKGLTPNVS